MTAIQAFQNITMELIETLQQENDRDKRITKIQSLLNQREELLKLIQPPFSPQEKELGKQLIKLDQQVKGLMGKQKIDIMQDLKSARMKKQSNQKYTNPYESMGVDGIFFDKQK
ncbi:MAG: flagellar protein FliT [Bacillus sp. (in: firmicutes)]